jgi:hypothetical protein
MAGEEERFSVAFYGASDDLIEVEGKLPGCDEYDSDDEIFEICGLRVRVTYENNGCWAIGVKQISEDIPVTARNIRLGLKQPMSELNQPYSMLLEFDAPKGSYVTLVKEKN